MPEHEEYIKMTLEEIEDGETDGFFYDENVICPWCGYEHIPDCEDEYYYQEGDFSEFCQECNREFIIEPYIQARYSTKRKGGDVE